MGRKAKIKLDKDLQLTSTLVTHFEDFSVGDLIYSDYEGMSILISFEDMGPNRKFTWLFGKDGKVGTWVVPKTRQYPEKYIIRHIYSNGK